MISHNFDRAEFSCRCNCGFDTVDTELLAILERIRERFGSPVQITSGCRCPSHNTAVGGADKSQHMYGRAADIKVKGYSPYEVADFFNSEWPDEYGMKPYSSWVHVDSRNEKWRG